MSRAAAKPADRRKIILYATIAVVIIAIVVAIGLASRTNVVPNAASQTNASSALKVGDTAPPFSVQTTAGPFNLEQISSPVLLELFATWCPHCQRETAVMNSVATKYAGKVAIVAVSASPYGIDGSSPESAADVNNFGAQFQVRYPLAYDAQLSVAHAYLKEGFPTLVLIDGSKKVRWMTSGETKESDIDAQVAKVI